MQTIQHRLHRTGVRLLVAIKVDGTVGEHRKPWHEAHHRTRKTAEYFCIASEPIIRRRNDRNRSIGSGIDLATYAKRTQRVHHQLGVTRAQQADQTDGCGSKRRENEITIRQ